MFAFTYGKDVSENDTDDSEDDSEEDENGMGGGKEKASSKWAHQQQLKVRHSVPGERFLHAKTQLSVKELREVSDAFLSLCLLSG